MGEIKKNNPQSSWIMELEVSNQPRRKVIADSYGDLRSNINISPKLARHRTWQDVITLDKEAALADCKAKSYEYGDALISRDVACDELKERKKEDERLYQQQDNFHQASPISKKKENVSVSSELPVAKSKWGVKLRHVITRDASLDDKSEVEQPIYNFRTLSKRRPQSALLDDEIPKVSQDVNKLWRSKSNELILDSTNDEDINDYECISTLSVLQRMKSFELNTMLRTPLTEKPVETATFTKETDTKPLCLEDLLNLDKRNLSIDVIDKSVKEKREKYSESRSVSSGGIENDLHNANKETLNNVLQKDLDNYSKVVDDHISKKSVRNISPKKLNVFGKIKSKQTKKAITLEELLKLDEQSLSIDVLDKCKAHVNNELNVSNSCNLYDSIGDPPFKTEKQMTLDFALESGQNSDLQNRKCANDTSSMPDFGFKIDTTSRMENQIDYKSSPVKGVEKVFHNSTKSIETKPIEPKTPVQQRTNTKNPQTVVPNLNLKEKMLNEKLVLDAKKNDTNTRYNKLGQIILSNDTMFEHGLVKNKSKLSNHDNVNINSNSELKSTENTGFVNYHTRVDSDIKYNKLGQIILSSDNQLENRLSAISKTETCDNASNNTEVENMRNSELINQSDWKMDPTLELSLKKSNEICDINNNENIVGVIGEVSSVDSTTSKKNMHTNSSNVTKQYRNECHDQKCKNDVTNVSIKPTPTGPTLETKKTIDQPPEISLNVPINRKVGKLIIMTGEQRNENLKQKSKLSTPRNLSKDCNVNGILSGCDIEDLKKNHKEGFSLMFMSNELEDDGIPDDYPIPRIVFNERIIGLKSMLSTQKNMVKKNVLFNPTTLVTIHSYSDDETYCLIEGGDDVKITNLDDINSESTFSNQPFPNVKTYEPSYSFDFGSVIQRERQRFNSMDVDSDNLTSAAIYEPTFDYNPDGDHFNTHHNQDGGHALLF